MILTFPILLKDAFGIGLYSDKYNITSEDVLKSNEMINRYLITGDIKNQEFLLLQTTILLQTLNVWLRKDAFDAEKELENAYHQYLEKWNPTRTI